MIPCSVFIVAQDEANNIERVLRSVSDLHKY